MNIYDNFRQMVPKFWNMIQLTACIELCTRETSLQYFIIYEEYTIS